MGVERPSRGSVAPNSSTPITPAPPSPAHVNRLGGALRPTLLKPLRFSKDPMPEDEAVKAPVPGIPPLQKPVGWGPQPQQINSTPKVSHQASGRPTAVPGQGSKGGDLLHMTVLARL